MAITLFHTTVRITKILAKYSLAAGIVLGIFLLFACQTVPEEIPSDLNKQIFFKDAQEFMDSLNWDAALMYLNEFKRRFPDDRADILAADYQIALIYYKQQAYNRALESFKAILDIYTTNDSGDESGELYEWVRVLSEKLIDRIENQSESEETEDAEETSG